MFSIVISLKLKNPQDHTPCRGVILAVADAGEAAPTLPLYSLLKSPPARWANPFHSTWKLQENAQRPHEQAWMPRVTPSDGGELTGNPPTSSALRWSNTEPPQMLLCHWAPDAHKNDLFITKSHWLPFLPRITSPLHYRCFLGSILQQTTCTQILASGSTSRGPHT